jgi:hypothetical protein
MSLIGVLVGCNKTFCNGTITCGQFDLTKCASVSGCTPGPACEVRTNQPQSCTTATDQVSCAAPMCNWIDNACVPFCRTLTTETTCNGYQSSEKDQYGSSLWGCGWVQCLGTPEIGDVATTQSRCVLPISGAGSKRLTASRTTKAHGAVEQIALPLDRGRMRGVTCRPS